MFFKLAALSPLLLATAHTHPSSLLQLSGTAQNTNQGVNADEVIASIQKQVSEFQQKMNDEVAADKDQVRKLQEQQRKMERDEKAFKAKIFAKKFDAPDSPVASFAQVNSHFGDPYIDEAMRTIGDDIDSQKREMSRLLAASHHASAAESLVQEKAKAKRPDLGVIAAALKTRLAMVGK